MKKLISLILAFTVLFSITYVIPASAVELLQNGGFEFQNQDKSATNWSKYGDASVSVVKADDAVEGKNVLQMISEDKSGYVLQQVEGLGGGVKVSFQASLKIVKLSGSAAIKFEFFGTDESGNSKYVGGDIAERYENANNKWETIKKDFVVPEGADKIKVYIRLFDGGEIYWDDVSVTADVKLPENKTDVDILGQVFAEMGMDEAAKKAYAEADDEYVMPIDYVDFTDIAGKDYEEAVSLLGNLGIVKGREEGKYMPEAFLTRAEMVTIILRVFGMGEFPEAQIFNDVPKEHWAFNHVMAAYKMGIVNGMDEVTFAPDREVTYEQAVKMLVCALGYEQEAMSLGGYPSGYIEKAKQINMLSRTQQEGSDKVSRGVMAQLVNNCINVTSYALKKADEKTNTIYLKNADSIIISAENPLYINDGTVKTDVTGLYEWDTISIVKAQNGKVIKYVRTPYEGGDWSLVSSGYDWVKKEKIKMIYGSILELDNRDSVIMPAIEAGCNAFAFNILGNNRGKNFDLFEKDLDMIVDFVKANGVQAFVKINFGDRSFFQNTAFGAYNTGTSTEYSNSPCPLSETYWEKQLVQKFALVATQPEIAGVVFDMEMYTTDSSVYPGPCFCDECYGKFLKERGYESDSTLKNAKYNERATETAKKGLTKEYEKWFEDRVAALLRKVERTLHKINPDLILAYMPAFEWLKGISRGLGTPEMPSLILSEKEYWGSLADTGERLDAIENQGYPSVYLVGLWNDPLAPSKFREKIEEAGALDAGYWVYAAQYFRAEQKRSYVHTEEVTPEKYFAALKAGNKRVSELAASGEKVILKPVEVPMYTAKRISGVAPTEEEWKNAPFTEDFVLYSNNAASSIKTNARILHNGKSMFIRITNYEPRMKELSAPETEREGKGFWSGDVNEIFWKYGDGADAMHIGVNRAGTVWDAYSSGVGTENSTFNFDIKATSETLTDKWITTTEIPLTMNGIRYPAAGETIRVELGRQRPLSANDKDIIKTSCWAVTYGTFLGSQSLWGKVVIE